MTSEESLAWLFSTQQFGIKLGLDNIRLILAELGNPESELPIIHVAGTNGKGSTCSMLDAISRASGQRTGLYTSPHLVDFRERVRIDGVKIPAEKVALILTRIRDLAVTWEHQPTFFEIVTALALKHFADERCELVILETGMGGRLDATNAPTPRVCVITPVSFDHTQWLGKTLREIAAEKAGIFKEGVPIVSAPQEPDAQEVLERIAAEKHARLRIVARPWSDGPLGLKGDFQRENAALALAALEAAGFPATPEEARTGLRDVFWPGRFQVLDSGIILDGGHNPQACRQLVKNWRASYGEAKATVIFGALADKAYGEMLEIIAPIVGEMHFVPVQNHRGCPPAELAAKWPGASTVHGSVAEALPSVKERPLLIAGSLFLIGEAMSVLGLEA